MNRYSLDDITWVSIELTNICNMTCDYCPKSLDELDHRKIGADVLEQETYLKIIEFMHNLKNLNYVTLTDFNEFFQTPHLTTFYLPELKKRSIPYLIASNGSIKPKHIEYYASHNPKYLVLGVQTITADQYYGNHRLEKVSWEEYLCTVADNIRFFYENCPDTLISIEVAVNPHNTFLYKLSNSVTNSAIPSAGRQLKYLPDFVRTLSEMTGIEYFVNNEDAGRYSGQKTLYSSQNNRIVFGLKEFYDISDFYNNLPVSRSPVCHADSLTFNVKGGVKMCCIDFRNSTRFADASRENIDTIFNRYLGLVNEMRTNGSPFEDCKKCMGYKSHLEKYTNPVKPLKAYLRRFPAIRKMYKFLTRS